jgi:hypothetical protein
MHQDSSLGGGINKWAALAVSSLLLAACGSSSASSGSGSQARGSGSVARTSSTTAPNPQAVAARFCKRAASAASARLRIAVSTQIADTDPAYLECILNGGGAHVDLVAQGVAQALGDYDTTLIHQVQTYVYPPPANGVRDRSQLPHPIPGIGVKAAWIPGQQRLLATNGTHTRGGDFLSVTVTGRARSAAARLALARAIAAATLPVAPRGPNLLSEH